MKLEKLNLNELKTLNRTGSGKIFRADRREILDEFLNSDMYAMKLVFGRDDEEEMMNWLSTTGKTSYDYCLSVYNSYASIISDNETYKNKIRIKRYTKKSKSGESTMFLYLVRKDRTMAFGNDCQRKGYEF